MPILVRTFPIIVLAMVFQFQPFSGMLLHTLCIIKFFSLDSIALFWAEPRSDFLRQFYNFIARAWNEFVREELPGFRCWLLYDYKMRQTQQWDTTNPWVFEEFIGKIKCFLLQIVSCVEAVVQGCVVYIFMMIARIPADSQNATFVTNLPFAMVNQ